jgi:hypothetical protein
MAQAIFEPTLSSINTLTILNPSYSSYLTAYEDGTECSETSAYEIQTPRNNPEESLQHLQHDESLKSVIISTYSRDPIMYVQVIPISEHFDKNQITQIVP